MSTTNPSDRRTLTDADAKSAALREAVERLERLAARKGLPDEVRIEIQIARDAVKRGMQ